MGNIKSKFLNLVYKLRQISYVKSVFNWIANVAVNPDSAMQVAAFYRGVNYISTSIANLPVDIKNKKNEIVENKITQLLNVSPNLEMNAHVFKLLGTVMAILHGNFYCEIERDSLGRPIAIWPINEYDVAPWRDANGVLWYRVGGGSVVRNGEDALIRPRDILHIRNIFTKDGFLGQGLVAYAKDTLGINLNANRMASNLYGNMGMPSGILSFDGTLSKEAAERVKEQWKSTQGGDKIGGTAVLEAGAKFQPLNLTPDVLQFLESRKFGVLEIARFLGVPPTKLYDGDSSSYNNIEHNNLEVATDTLNTWARIWEAEIDMKLLGMQYGGQYCEFDLYDVFRGDMDKRSQYYTRLFNIGAMSSNEIRNKEGRAGYDGGGEYYVASNNLTPVSRLNEIIDANILSKQPQEKEETPKEEKTEEEKELDKAVTAYIKKKSAID